MKKTRSAIRIPMPLRYLINLVLILALWFVLYTLIQNGTITNYWSGILMQPAIWASCLLDMQALWRSVHTQAAFS